MRALPEWSLEGYRREWLRPDLIGGLSAGAVVLPQAMAYSTIASLPVQYGLYTCMLPMLVYAMLGGSRAISVSTTSTIATLVAVTLVVGGPGESSNDIARRLSTLTLMVAAVLLLAWLLQLGSLVENISVSVLTGIKVGVGATVAVGQLPKLLGIAADPDAAGFFPQLWSSVRRLDDASLSTVLLSVGTLAALFVGARFFPRMPAALVVVAAGIVLVVVANLDQHGIALIPEVPRGLPRPVAPDLDAAGGMLPAAIAIALMAFLETIAVGRGIRRADEPQIESDRELFATGAACVAGAFTRSLPSAGGFSQSAVNVRAGARSQLSQVVTVGLAIATAFLLAPVLSHLPQATLGALVTFAVLGLINPLQLVELWRINKPDFWVATATAVVGLTTGLLVAVAVGVGLTLFLVLSELSRPHLVEVTHADDGSWQPVTAEDEGSGRAGGLELGVLVLRVTAPLYTANARATTKAIETIAETRAAAIVVVDVRVLGVVSVTVLTALQDLERELGHGGRELWFAGLPAASTDVARRVEWWRQAETEGRVYPSLNTAVDMALARDIDTVD